MDCVSVRKASGGELSQTMASSAVARLRPSPALSVLQMMQTGDFGLDEIREFAADIFSEAERLKRMIEVLLDLGMPGMSGFDVVRELRARPETANAYIVATTGWGQAGDRRNTRKAGFDQHLVKPLDLAAIASILAARARHRR